MATERMADRADMASSLGRMALIWGPGVAAFSLSGPFGGWVRTAGWTLGLTWMAGMCLWNWARCRRVHCLFTGPFFLAMAVATVLMGFGLLPAGPAAWSILGDVATFGGVALFFAPEWIWGRYWRRPARPPEGRRAAE